VPRPDLRALAAALAAAALVVSAPIASAQEQTGALRVSVSDALGQPVEAAEVILDDGGGAGGWDALADAHGLAILLHVRPGRHHVRASGPAGASAEGEVWVAVGETTRLGLHLAAAAEGGGLTTSASADGAARFEDEALRGLPRAADPWSVLRDVPGIVLDRVDVGGSETGQQSLVLSRGDPGTGVTWRLDGIDVTDPAALGATSLYPDMDSMDAVEVRTSSLDVRVRTPGAQVALVTREIGRHWASRAHARLSGPRSNNLPAELAGHSVVRDQTERVSEIGADSGGAIGGGARVWAAWDRAGIREETFTGHEDRLHTTNLALRASARAGAGTLSLLGLRSEKVDEDRDVTTSAAPEARWRQSGPSWLLALEDRRSLGRVSLLTRGSWLDAGFSLEPHGGTAASTFEDFRGVTQQSYQQFETDRPRLELGSEASAAGRGVGFDHLLVAGASLQRSEVTTRARWPGNQVLAFEREAVFFRAFGLTGFAIPTREQSARSLVSGWNGYVQDEARRGRLGVQFGARIEDVAGRNLASSVEANPTFPTLLPASSYPGGATEIRWLDLLPRAAVSWDLGGDGATLVRAGYAAYAASLGSGDVTSDNPIGGQGASLTYYWIDRNGNHAVDRGELDVVRGLLGASGVDPGSPSVPVSSNAIQPGLRSPRTHQIAVAAEHGGRRLHALAQVSWRRLVDPLWRPLRGLTLADYVIRGSVQGVLFGEPYDVGYYAPASLSRVAPGNGRLLANREGYRQETWTAEVAAGGRIGTRVSWDLSGAVSDWREFFTDPAVSIQDPTSTDGEPLLDGGTIAVRPGGLGRGDVFASARWTAAAALRATLPWRLVAATRLFARDGFPIPYFQVADTGDPTSGAKNVLVSPRLDEFRLPTVFLADARVERAFRAGRGTVTAALNAFNVLDRATTLQVTRDVDAPSFARPRDVLAPRIVRFDLEYRF